MKIFRDPYAQQYSTLVPALSIIFYYFGAGFLDYFGFDIPNEVWWYGLLLFGAGFLLEFSSSRLIFIRSYQASVFFSIAAVYTVLFIALITMHLTYNMKMIVTFVTLLAQMLTMIGAYRYAADKGSHSRHYPIGPYADLNTVTGIVTRARSPRDIKEQQNIKGGYARMYRLSPLIAGLSMLVAGQINGFSINIAVGVIAGVIAFSTATGTAGIVFWLIASARWESENELRIIVKR